MHALPLHVYTALQASTKPEQLLCSFQKYLKAASRRIPLPSEIIAADLESCLHFFPAKEPALTSLFLVPSLINGIDIFDVTEQVSFIRTMCAQNIDVYLLEWGDLSARNEFSLVDLQTEKMAPFWIKAINHARRLPHMLGYCLGGSLCLDFLGSHPVAVHPGSLTLLAAPVDFSASDVFWRPVLDDVQKVKEEIAARGCLTQRMLQSYFINLQPDYTEEKFLKYYGMPEGSESERRFVAVERWLNSGHDLPLALAKDLIDRYFIENSVLRHTDLLTGLPLCLIYSEQDKIVSPESAKALSGWMPSPHIIQTDCGHVGMMAGRRAMDVVWRPYIQYLASFATQQR